jgi:CPA2 family monovalent cation:H+ antiporter-2
MPHHTPLIATIVAGLVLAFIFGSLAHRLKASPLVGYLLAGVLVGPFTPGYVADQGLANELAEIGVILLMFGVGLHFSVRDLKAVASVAVPGAVIQIATATALGGAIGWYYDWPLVGSLVFGLALSVASTVVLLRALQERRLLDTKRGRIAIGWLIVEDLAMVLALVMIPAISGSRGDEAGSASLLGALAITLAKVVGFVAFMMIVGRRVIPWVLHHTAHSGSRELFRLAVLAIALGVAFGAALVFDVSFALGAFFAGMILSESELSQRAAEETLPLRDAFAVLFFVSVGMLFNPMILIEQTLPVLATLAIIVVGKSVAAFAIVRLFGHPAKTALTISVSLAQIGEFSFILAGLGVALKLFPPLARDFILAGAILSILLNPFLFRLIDWLAARGAIEPLPSAATASKGHAVIVGYGRVGALVGAAFGRERRPFVAIDAEDSRAAAIEADGGRAITGNAADGSVLSHACLAEAGMLLVAIPEPFEAGQIVEKARKLNPQLEIIARAHSDAEVTHLTSHGASRTIMGEEEIANRMIDHALRAAV